MWSTPRNYGPEDSEALWKGCSTFTECSSLAFKNSRVGIIQNTLYEILCGRTAHIINLAVHDQYPNSTLLITFRINYSINIFLCRLIVKLRVISFTTSMQEIIISHLQDNKTLNTSKIFNNELILKIKLIDTRYAQSNNHETFLHRRLSNQAAVFVMWMGF